MEDRQDLFKLRDPVEFRRWVKEQEKQRCFFCGFLFNENDMYYCPECKVYRNIRRDRFDHEKVPLYWRARKKLAIWYHHLLWKVNPNYIKKQMKKRRGSCVGCKWTWLCCVGCSNYDADMHGCCIHDIRPMGCKEFPVDRFQTLMMCGDGCQMRWSDNKKEKVSALAMSMGV